MLFYYEISDPFMSSDDEDTPILIYERKAIHNQLSFEH